jgi:YesN/AraC family two-component response regulator
MQEPIRVLIVDDNRDARSFLERLFTFEEDCEVVGEAENGQEAIDAVRVHLPHIVVMDLNMPIMDGISACGAIKKEWPATQVILISVQDDAGPIRAAIENGASAFLIKPVDPEDLLDLMRRAYNAYKAAAA